MIYAASVSAFGHVRAPQARPASWPEEHEWDPHAAIQFVVEKSPKRGDLFVGPADRLHLVCGFEGPGGAMYKLTSGGHDLGVTVWGRPADQDGNARQAAPLMEVSFVATMIDGRPYFGDPREVVVREYEQERST